MKLLYVAGPYRDKHGAYYVARNIEAAAEVAVELWRMGYAVICPHKNTAFFDGAAPDGVWLKGDLEMLRRCDGIVMINCWQSSVGAMAELEFARKNGLRVYDWTMMADKERLRKEVGVFQVQAS